MAEIKAIPTEYNGYLFRSRLEARWAVFFDALDIQYEYELEGFDLGDGIWYLPDFYLPNINGGTYVEVKGKMDDESRNKIMKFAGCGEDSLYVLGGIPTQAELSCNDINEYVDKYDDCFWHFSTYVYEADGKKYRAGDWPYLFCVCPACGRVGIEFDGRGWRVCGGSHRDKSLETNTYKDEKGIVHQFAHPEVAGWRTDDKGYSWNQRRLIAAYKVARQVQFEHGQTPTKQEVKRRYAAEMDWSNNGTGTHGKAAGSAGEHGQRFR